jgi:hypothetical protein
VYHTSSLALRGQLTAYPLPTLFTPCSYGGCDIAAPEFCVTVWFVLRLLVCHLRTRFTLGSSNKGGEALKLMHHK